MFHNSHNEAVPEATRSAARKCLAAEFISAGPGFCTNRQKASNVVQNRCSTEMNSVVDEDIGLVKFCSLRFSKSVQIPMPLGTDARNECGALTYSLPPRRLGSDPPSGRMKNIFAKHKSSGIGLAPVANTCRHFVTETHSALQPRIHFNQCRCFSRSFTALGLALVMECRGRLLVQSALSATLGASSMFRSWCRICRCWGERL